MSEELYALVNTTSIDATAFLKRAPEAEIELWARIYKSEGVLTKRLDSISDFGALQYLYWNTTQAAPGDTRIVDGEPVVDDSGAIITDDWSLEVLNGKCAELANNLPVDTTSVDELTARLPEGSNGLDEEDSMAKEKGELKKPSAKKEKAVKEAKPKKEKDPTGRPGEGTATRKVWEIADKLAAKNNDVTPTRKAVIEAAVKAGVNEATAGVQYGNWFRGMKRTPAPAVAKAEKPAKAKKAKAAAAAAETAEAEESDEEEEDEEEE